MNVVREGESEGWDGVGDAAALAPLSYSQQRFWFLAQLDPGNPQYLIPLALRLRGKLCVAALQASLDALVARHASLRTRYLTRNGFPLQTVDAPKAAGLSLVDFSAAPAEAREGLAQARLVEEARRPFDLTRDLLVRACLLRIDAEDHILALNLHHIAADGWSMGIVQRELGRLYGALLEGRTPELAALAYTYVDYARDQRRELTGRRGVECLEYWTRRLTGASRQLELPTDRPRPVVQTSAGDYIRHTLAGGMAEALRRFNRSERSTTFVTLLSAFQALLARYTGRTDLLVGFPVAGRNRLETEPIIGCFVNTLVHRGDVSGDPTFRELVRRTRRSSLEALSHQELPFERLIEAINPERRTDVAPLYQVMFLVEHASVEEFRLPGLEVNPVPVHSRTAKCDLILGVREKDGALATTIEYNTDLFDKERMERMQRHFEVLTAAALENPERAISQLPLLTEAERRLVLEDWGHADEGAGHRPRCVHELFEEQAAANADRAAVSHHEQVVSYRELDAWAARVAQALRGLGTAPGARVGLFMERSPGLIAAMLGILKAGAAYVPLDASHPSTRMAFILADAGVSAVVTERALAGRLPEGSAPALCIEDVRGVEERDAPETSLSAAPGSPAATCPDALAYVIYTSGSTGQPKGVETEHRAVAHFVRGAIARYGLGPGDRFLQFSTPCFDFSVEQIFCTLCSGATLVLRTDEMLASSRRFLDCCRRWDVSVVSLPTAFWHEITQQIEAAGDRVPERLRLLIVGGERALPERLAAWRRVAPAQSRFINIYGPTEVTVAATMWETRCDPRATTATEVPIGKPFPGYQVFLLDAALQPVAPGCIGEVCVGGPGLARGYANLPELTAARFIRHPFSSDPSARVYRTGDLARHLPDGNLVFHGRRDGQVKIRGFRVEVSEIEAVLREAPGVGDAVVVLRELGPGENALCGYVTGAEHATIDTAAVRAYLRARLPEYMVPGCLQALAKLPLNANGKIDRASLPAPVLVGAASSAEAPRDRLDFEVLQLWRETLARPDLGLHDNFFDSGGHSLLAVRLFAAVEDRFGKQLPLMSLFQGPTARAQAALLRAEGWQQSRASLVSIQAGDTKSPFFCVHGGGGGVLYYADLARQMGVDQTFYGLQAAGFDGEQTPLCDLRAMAGRYVEEVLAMQRLGPYHLGGACMGGMVAFEMARQLLARGHEVGLLALIDTPPPAGRTLAGYYWLRLRRGWKYFVVDRARFHALRAWRRVSGAFRQLAASAAHASTVRPREAPRLASQAAPARPPDRHRARVHEANIRAMQTYRAAPYAGSLTLFLAEDSQPSERMRWMAAWQRLVTGAVVPIVVPGDHNSMVRAPLVEHLAQQLRARLDDVRGVSAIEAEPQCLPLPAIPEEQGGSEAQAA